MVHRVGRTPTLVFVSILCLLQFFWTLAHDRVTGWPLAGAILGVLAMNGLFHLLYRWGRAPALTAGGVPAAER